MKSWRKELIETLDEVCALNPSAVIGGAIGIDRKPVSWWNTSTEDIVRPSAQSDDAQDKEPA